MPLARILKDYTINVVDQNRTFADLFNGIVEGNDGNNYANVTWPTYGAAGDGVTDDTVAIQLALTTVSASGGGIVELPYGTFLVSDAAANGYCLSIPDNIVLVGSGYANTTIKAADSSNAHVLYSTGGTEIGVRHLTVDGNKTNQTAGGDKHGIYWINGHDFWFDHVRVINSVGHGFFLSNANGTECTFDHCIAEDCGTSGGTSGTGFAGNWDTVTFTACRSQGSQLAGFKNTGNYVTYLGCISKSNLAEGFSGGFDAQSGIYHRLVGCEARLNGSDGYRFASQVDRIQVIGCYGDSNDQSGLCSLNTTQHLTVSGCQFMDNGQGASADSTNRLAGIALIDTTGANTRVTISGCNCSDTQGTPTQSYGIEILNETANVTVAGDNILSGNATQAFYCASTTNTVKALAGIQGMSSDVFDATSNSHTGDTNQTDLTSATITGNEMTRNGMIRIRAAGDVSGTNGTKTIRLHIGTTSLVISSQTSAQEFDWQADAEIMLITYASQRGSVVGREGSGGNTVAYANTLSEDFTSDLDIKCSVTLGNAADTVTQRFLSIERIR